MPINTFDTQLGLDPSQYLSGLRAAIAATGAHAQSIDSLIAVSENFNKQGALTGATVKALTADFRELTFAVKVAADAQTKAATVTDVQLLNQTRNMAQANRDLVTNANKVNASSLRKQIQELFPAPDNATNVELTKYQLNLNKIIDLVERGKVSVGRVQGLITDFGQNKISPLDLTREDNRVIQSLIKLSSSQTAVNPQVLADSQFAGRRTRDAFPAPSNLTLSQLARYESQIAKIQALIVKGSVSSARFEDILNAFQSRGLDRLNLTDNEQKIVNSLQQVSRGFNTAKESAEQFHLGLRNVFRITEALLFKEVIGSIVSSMQDATKQAAEYQIKISEIRTLATENEQSFGKWSKTIADVSNQLNIPQAEVAKAAYEALSAQIVNTDRETAKFVKTAGDLARVGVGSISQAANTLQSVMNSYGLSAERAEEISAKLFVAIDRGSFTLADIAGNMGRVNNTAAALGISLDEVLAAMATLTRQGNNAADAQTQLSNVFLKLQNPTQATEKFLKSLGFETGQAAIQALGFVGTLKAIETATNADIAVLSEFGGELRAIRGLIGLTTRDKGAEFATDLDKIQNGSLAGFNQARVIRAESPADQLTKELNIIKNFFQNEFGQSFLGVINENTKAFGGLSNIVQNTVRVLVPFGTVFLTVYTTSKLVTGSMGLLTKTVEGYVAWKQRQIVADTASTVALTRGQQAMLGVQTALKGIGAIAVFSVMADEIARVKRELDPTIKKTEEYANVLDRIQKARVGQTKDGKIIAAETFTNNILKESADFALATDNLFRPILQQQAVLNQQTQQQLIRLREEGKETATQLSVGFKSALDSIGRTVNTYAEGIRKADQSILNSKRSILSIKDTVEGLIFDLKFDFASTAQRFILRDQQIQQLTNEATRLLSSNNEEDLAKGRQIAQQVLQRVREDARERVQAQVDADREARARAVQQGGLDDGRPIFAFTGEQEQRLRDFAQYFSELEQQAISRKEKEKAATNQLLIAEKERQTLLEKRIKAFEALTPVNAAGDLNPEFKDTRGQFQADKFNSELTKRSNAVTELLKTEEEKNAVLVLFEKQKLNFLQQQSKQIELQKISLRQLELGKLSQASREAFEKAAKERLSASERVDAAGKELGTTGQLVRDFVQFPEEKFSTIGQNEDRFTRFSLQLARGFIDGLNKLPGRQLAATDAERILINNKQQVDLIQKLVDDFNRQAQAVTRRDTRGNLLAQPEDIRNLRNTRGELLKELEIFIARFTNKINNENVAPQAGGITLGELRNQTRSAIDQAEQALITERNAARRQQTIGEDLRNFVDPVTFDQLNATRNLAEQINLNSRAVADLTNQLRVQPVVPPANIPPVVPQGGGFHNGGLITGPLGYDNLNIRAEAGEFIVNRVATKQWFPQLVAMNKGLNPKVAGRYHEGGLVQTTVGDVNVTISTPSTPERTVKQLGQAIRREIRRGNLNLNKKG